MTGKGRIWVGVLAALLVVDVALVGLAIRHTGGSGDAATAGSRRAESVDIGSAGAGPSPSASPASTSTASPTASPTGSDTPPAGEAARPAEGLLANVGAGSAVIRATSGSCGGQPGSVELSTDGGDSFSGTDLGDPAVVLRVSSEDTGDATVYTAGPDCEQAATLETHDGGQSWERTDGTSGRWHLLPEPGVAVHAPDGEVDVPCAGGETVQGISIVSNELVYALCSGGTLYRTTDSGQDWERRAEVPGARGVDFSSQGTGLVAATGDGSCSGIAVLATVDGGSSWDRTACLSTSGSDGPIALAVSGERDYVQAGDQRWTSDDAGYTWEQRGD